MNDAALNIITWRSFGLNAHLVAPTPVMLLLWWFLTQNVNAHMHTIGLLDNYMPYKELMLSGSCRTAAAFLRKSDYMMKSIGYYWINGGDRDNLYLALSICTAWAMFTYTITMCVTYTTIRHLRFLVLWIALKHVSITSWVVYYYVDVVEKMCY